MSYHYKLSTAYAASHTTSRIMGQNDWPWLTLTPETLRDLCCQLNRIDSSERHLSLSWSDPLTYIFKLNFKYFPSQPHRNLTLHHLWTYPTRFHLVLCLLVPQPATPFTCLLCPTPNPTSKLCLLLLIISQLSDQMPLPPLWRIRNTLEWIEKITTKMERGFKNMAFEDSLKKLGYLPQRREYLMRRGCCGKVD